MAQNNAGEGMDIYKAGHARQYACAAFDQYIGIAAVTGEQIAGTCAAGSGERAVNAQYGKLHCISFRAVKSVLFYSIYYSIF